MGVLTVAIADARTVAPKSLIFGARSREASVLYVRLMPKEKRREE
jgi:hypothetical protein